MLTTCPITDLHQLWNWDENIPHCLIGNSLENYTRHRNCPETLLCHDMKGGYLDEERLDGCEVTDSTAPFMFFHWWYIDIFVYFSHHFVTIPPLGWINQAHMHGVIVLGRSSTRSLFLVKAIDQSNSNESSIELNRENVPILPRIDHIARTVITEWHSGADICKEFLKNEDGVTKTVQKLVNIAVKYNFEGWLINIENKIEAESIMYLDLFLRMLTNEMRQTVGERSRVIWYDSVTIDGELKWQNELNDKNQRWFDITDGIFLNYIWNVKQLSTSAIRAKHRHRNIFVGIDCFGRGCHGDGGWNCHQAFMYPRQNNLSIALFAPGWIVETMPSREIIINSLRFWDRLVTFVRPHPLTTLPIDTDFSFGYQYRDTCKASFTFIYIKLP
ncbi:glycosyl hydrolase family 85 protein [Wuchereria bancrofti]|uniref:Glycosyl hydrolase family 85 protein n=1 Tax=Wuchereria bancrofti TaxID=6293 RepID=J9F561_WUCBA|nr:glycosyl hydrolase family 85 protein [Wuchereria bancrofti]